MRGEGSDQVQQGETLFSLLYQVLWGGQESYTSGNNELSQVRREQRTQLHKRWPLCSFLRGVLRGAQNSQESCYILEMYQVWGFQWSQIQQRSHHQCDLLEVPGNLQKQQV